MKLFDEIKFSPGTVICRLPEKGEVWGIYQNPVEVLSVCSQDELTDAMEWLEDKLANGFYLAGFLSYEAAPAFDKAFSVNESCSDPLFWFGAYSCAPDLIDLGSLKKASGTFFDEELEPEIGESAYKTKVSRVLDYIFEGDIYQANFTFGGRLPAVSKPEELFASIVGSHPVPFAAFVQTEDESIVSVSPELFLDCRGGELLSSPMKGTARRKLTLQEDKRVKAELARDEKNCAENLMIVDMVRNDFGRVCRPGTVKVDPVFQVDTYKTVHQMISTVHGELNPGVNVTDVLKATYPAASITGAPKVRAMEVINELEVSSRGVYTGAIGCFYPYGEGGKSDFLLNVPIRTLVCRREYTDLHIGSGVVADSATGAEWRECLLKSRFASHREPEFQLLETLLWTPENGYSQKELHWMRMCASQSYFGRQLPAKFPEHLSMVKSSVPLRVRWLMDEKGSVVLECYPLKQLGWATQKLRVLLSSERTDRNSVCFYHKTTHRKFYNEQYRLSLSKGYDEVLFLNQGSELTEGAITNLFVEVDGQWYTPPVESGLLAGIWRQQMMIHQGAVEKVLFVDDLYKASRVVLGNSLRGCCCVESVLIDGKEVKFENTSCADLSEFVIQ